MAAETRVPDRPDDAPPPPGPFSPDQFLPTLIMIVVAALGGLVNFYRKYKAGHVRAFNLVELIGELVISGICGLFGYWLFRGFGVNEYLTAAGVGVVGHMGSRAIFAAEEYLSRRFGLALSIDEVGRQLNDATRHGAAAPPTITTGREP